MFRGSTRGKHGERCHSISRDGAEHFDRGPGRPMSERFIRLMELDRAEVTFVIDGQPASALSGDTLLTALLTTMGHVRRSEFGDGNRAGFCLMGACQDCWVWTEEGQHLRACTTDVTDGMRILTEPGEMAWPRSA
jgi:D-hydroxyproline dehydrogenase subunit gamma